MQIIRHAPGEASLTDGGRNLLDLVASEAGEAEFEALLDRLEALLAPRGAAPRIAVTWQEGLVGTVQAEIPIELIMIEDDPHDLPPLRLTRRDVVPDPVALAALLDRTERRLTRSAR